MATETEVRTNEETEARDRLDVLRGAPYGERVSRLEERSEITWQMLLDERRLNQERFKTMLEKFDKVDEKFDKVNDKFDSLYKTLIIGLIGLGSIGVAAAGIIVTLIIFVLRGQ